MIETKVHFVYTFNKFKAFYAGNDKDSVLDDSVDSNSSSPINNRQLKNNVSSSTSDSAAADKAIVDLDLIVEKFIGYMWDKTKSKSDKKYEFEDLDILINWSKMDFIQDEAKFDSKNCGGVKEPQNQTLFKTFFVNRTNSVQEYSFKTQRVTRQSCCFSFTKGFTREKEAAVKLKIPYDIVEIGGGIKSEQSIECGKDQTKEEEITWGCDSMINVQPHTKTSASLIITELEMDRSFSLTIYLKGESHFPSSLIIFNQVKLKFEKLKLKWNLF